MRKRTAAALLGGTLLSLAVVAVGAGWIIVLGKYEPFSESLGQALPWPVVCSTRGCITTQDWHTYHAVNSTFASNVGIEQPSPSDTLTTLVRHHLTRHAFLRSPATPADAARYRREVLNAKDDAAIEQTTGLTAPQYDATVIMPYLQQEALRQQHNTETTEELYHILAEERRMVVLLFHYHWDKDSNRVVRD